MQPDRYDRQIPELLQGWANSNQELPTARAVARSACAGCAHRGVRLICGYRALRSDARKLGLSLMALIHIRWTATP